MDNSLNIFLSYGHEHENTINGLPAVVYYIEKALRKRNHKVWVDINEIPQKTSWPDSDWRSSIYNAINSSDNVVGLLSEHGLRDSGVCLDELSIAVSKPGRKIVTVLLESQATMRIPSTVSRIQWVDMSEWKTHFDFETNTFTDDYFEGKFKEIIQRVENAENFVFQYDINFLLECLAPSDTVNCELHDLLKKEYSDNGIVVYEDRLWINEMISEFVNGNEKQYVLLYGGAGYGKSQFMAHIIHNSAEVYAYYFNKYHTAKEKCNLFLRTLAFELAAKMPDYRSALIASIKSYPFFSESLLAKVLEYHMRQNDSDLFDMLFHNDKIKFIDGNPGNVIIALDALDEAEINNCNAVLDILIQKREAWPKFFKFILTSRGNSDILNRLEIMENKIKFINLDDDRSNYDIEKYLRNILLRTGKITEELVEPLVKKCEKTFNYANLLVKSIDDGTIQVKTAQELEALPKGYSGLLFNYFKRIFVDGGYEKVKMPLGILLANSGAVSKNILQKIMQSSTGTDWTYAGFLARMKSFIVEKGSDLSFYHKALNDWLASSASDEFCLSVDFYKKIVIDFCKKYVSSFAEFADLYDARETFELLMGAEGNGFDYETVKFVSVFLGNNLSQTVKRKFFEKNAVFLLLTIYQAYKSSDLIFADNLFTIIKGMAANIDSRNEQERLYIAIAYSFFGEIEVARGNFYDSKKPEGSVEGLNHLNCVYGIDYFLYIKMILPEISEYERLYASTEDNIAFITRLYDNKSSENAEKALQILDDLEKYINKRNFIGKANSYAHLCYHQGIVYYDKKLFDEAIASLEKGLEKSDEYESEDAKAAKCLKSFIYNQLAACYNGKAQNALNSGEDGNISEKHFEKCIEYIKLSLALKIECYGEKSFYTATAYDNYARWQRNYEISKKDFSVLSQEVYIMAEKGMRIRQMVLSEKGILTARSYMTLAFCYKADCKYDLAIEWAKKAYEIKSDLYRSQFKEVVESAVSYSEENGDCEAVYRYSLLLEELANPTGT